MRNRRSQGAAYEHLACSYLKRKGYKILDRNVYLMRKELDVVALSGETVVFVEVKGRRSGRFGTPGEAVGIAKRKHIVGAASAYLDLKNLRGRPCRFDVVAVTFEAGNPRIEHIENAFEA
jgi:putative endonuclease